MRIYAPVGGFGRAATIQLRCLRALIVRDMLMRYGRGNLGFLWVLIEPMLLTMGVMLLWSMIKGERDHGVRIISFVLTGYLPLTLWRHLTTFSIMCISRNASLLFHRNLTAYDVFFARMTLEFAGATAALIVITSSALALDLIDPIQDWCALVAGWMSMTLFSFGASIVICGLTEFSEVWERLIPPWQYLQLPVCGCFFMVDWLPYYVQGYAWYVPSVHCYEAFRLGFLGSAVTTHFDLWYPCVWGIFLISMGLVLFDAARDKVHYG